EGLIQSQPDLKMRRDLVTEPCLELIGVTGVKTSEPPREIDLPAALRRGIEFKAPARETIVARRQPEAVGDLERLKQPLELRDVVELDVLAGIQFIVDRGGEDAPALDPARIEPCVAREAELVEHLPHVEKVFRARVEFRRDAQLVHVR